MLRYMPVPVPVQVPGNCQTVCDHRLKAGPLRGDTASPGVSEGMGGANREIIRPDFSRKIFNRILIEKFRADSA